MKLSKFNVCFEENGKKYVTNTVSKAVIEVNDDIYRVVTGREKLQSITEYVEQLSQQGIVVDETLDEIGVLRYAYNKARFDTKHLDFVVAPTLECNFKCRYCFETPRRGVMSEEVQKKLVLFIRRKVKETQCLTMKFTWYGGEPLLCMDIIEYVTKEIQDVCQEYNVELAIGVVTNGYLLTEETARRLINVGINNYQVTIDGVARIHDSRRMLHSGKGTYKKILENLVRLREYDIHIRLRTNIDQQNHESYKRFIKIIEKLELHNVSPYAAIVEIAQNQPSDVKSACMSDEEYGEFSLTANLDFYKSEGDFLDKKTCHCPAETVNSYVIDELGSVYKCWNSIGYDKEVLFNIGDEKEEYEKEMAALYLGRDPFSEVKCIECPYIPLCVGGCCYERIEKGENVCQVERYLYKKIISDKVV